jgi:hypothetical protein
VSAVLRQPWGGSHADGGAGHALAGWPERPELVECSRLYGRI